MSSHTSVWKTSGNGAPEALDPFVWLSGKQVPADFDTFGWINNNRNQVPDEFANAFNTAAEASKWIIVAGVVSAVASTLAIVAIVYAIINCLNKAARNGGPAYARLEMGQEDSIPPPSTSKLVSKATTNASSTTMPPGFNVILNSQVEAATMERFLSNIAKEKPIRFSPQQLADFTQDYSTVLGSGGYGVVYRGEFPNGVPVAVKVLKGNLGKQVEEQFMAEVSTIGRTNHVNLVRLYGFCFDSMMQALVYEFMENGSIGSFLCCENRTLEWEKLHEIAIGTAKGIAYLHEECQQRIIHYDIKADNVLLDSKLCPKVADFGLAKLCNRDSSHVTMTGYRGTPGYAAPELYKPFKPFPVTHKCDVYSFGMLLFEIVGRRRNLNLDLSESQEWLPGCMWEKFEKGELMELLDLCGIEGEDKGEAERMCLVALWCVQHKPDARPLMSTVVKMLEGGVEIAPPLHPFPYLVSARSDSAKSSGSIGDSNSSSSIESSENSTAPLPRARRPVRVGTSLTPPNASLGTGHVGEEGFGSSHFPSTPSSQPVPGSEQKLSPIRRTLEIEPANCKFGARTMFQSFI